MAVTVRPARPEDVEAVTAFTANTWTDREAEDYLPDVFEDWVRSDDADQHPLVATVDGAPVGVLQVRLLSPDEAWCQGMRVHPDYRGKGIGRAMTHTGWDWAADRGAAVARNMIFGWNREALAAAQSVGFEPTCGFRWAHPSPTVETGGRDPSDPHGPGAAWQYWQGSRARDTLAGLAIDPDVAWALSVLRRETLGAAAVDGRLLTVGEDRLSGFAVRNRTFEHEADPWVEYAVAAWRDRPAAGALLDRIRRDAARVGAVGTRVPVPETATEVSHVAAAGAPLADTADIVFTADLTVDDRSR